MTDEDIFLTAAEMADPADRAAYLDKVCGRDAGVRRKVDRLLAAHFKPGVFLEELLLQQVSAALGGDAPTPPRLDTGEGGVAAAPVSAEEPVYRAFLGPTTHPGSLGRLGHYEALEVLGRGGFGIVFRAFDPLLERVIAIKMLAPGIAATSPARKRFLREASSSARVRHENVVQVYAVEEKPLPFLVMEFVAGETLQQRLDRTGPLETAEIVRLGRQIADGLAAAHATGLIHRDVKPGNILIEAGALRVKLTDFGLARTADDASRTQSGVLAGTPMFMAPEQAQGEPLDPRADLFSLGSVLYVMATGRPPFRAATSYAVLKRVVEDTPRPVRDVIPEVPTWLCEIITKLHAKKPGDRYQSAREVAQLLADCESRLTPDVGPDALAPAPPARSGTRRSGKWKWVVAAVLLATLAPGVTELAGLTHLFRRKEPGPGRAPGDDPVAGVVAKQEPERQSEPVPRVRKEGDPKPKDVAARPADPDRRAAEFVLAHDGVVHLEGDARDIRAAADLPGGAFRLAGVDLGYQPVAASELAVLGGCEHLTRLSLYGESATDAGLAQFQNCAGWTHLSLHDAGLVTDAGLAHLAGCRKLVMLDLSNARQVGDAGLAYFKDCRDLEHLSFYGTQVGDAGLAHFKDCPNVHSVYLAGTPVTAAGLARLKDWKNLTALGLDDCPQVTDAALAHLTGLYKLIELNLCKTRVTDTGVTRLAKALPGCKIRWGGGVIGPR